MFKPQQCRKRYIKFNIIVFQALLSSGIETFVVTLSGTDLLVASLLVHSATGTTEDAKKERTPVSTALYSPSADLSSHLYWAIHLENGEKTKRGGPTDPDA